MMMKPTAPNKEPPLETLTTSARIATITITGITPARPFLTTFFPVLVLAKSPSVNEPNNAGIKYPEAVLTAGSSNIGLIHVLRSAASARRTTVIIEHTATATEAIASPAGVLGSFLVIFMALTAHGTLRFIMLPVINVRYDAEPSIGVYVIASENPTGIYIRSIPNVATLNTIPSVGMQPYTPRTMKGRAIMYARAITVPTLPHL